MSGTRHLGAGDRTTRVRTYAERTLALAPIAVWLIASLLRLLCTRFDYPNPTHPDEWTIVNAAARTIREGDLNPHFFNYPSFLIYLEAALLETFGTLGLVTPLEELTPPVNAPNWYETIHLGRVAVALLCGATAALTAYAGQVIRDRSTGALAGLLVAFSVLHLSYSHTLTVDGPTAFFVAAALLGALRLTQPKRRLHHYVLGGLAVGLAAGTKYTGGATLLPFVLAHFVGARQDGERWLDWRPLVGLLAVGLAFALSTPYAIIEWESVQRALQIEAAHYRRGHPGFEAEGARSYLDYGRHLWTQGGPLLVVGAALGVPIAAADRRLRGPLLVLLSFVLVYAGIIGNYRVHFARNLMPLMPFLAVLAAAGITGLVRRAMRVPALGVVLALSACAAFGHDAWRGADYVRRMRLPDTHTVAERWIHEHLPPGSVIVVELYNPPISPVRFEPRFTNLNGLMRYPFTTVDADYMITVSDEYARYLDDPEHYPHEAARYRALFVHHPTVRRFEDDGETMRGPTIVVLRQPRPDERIKTETKPTPPEDEAEEPPPPPPPAVHPGAATVGAALGRDEVRMAIAARLGALQVCYVNGLASTPRARGTIRIRFVVDGDGHVENAEVAESTLASEVIEACMVQTLAETTFPRPDHGARVDVEYPFTLSNPLP